jgi:hypothetical protein
MLWSLLRLVHVGPICWSTCSHKCQLEDLLRHGQSWGEPNDSRKGHCSTGQFEWAMLAGQFHQPLVWFATWSAMMQKYWLVVWRFYAFDINGLQNYSEPQKLVPYSLQYSHPFLVAIDSASVPQLGLWCSASQRVAFSIAATAADRSISFALQKGGRGGIGLTKARGSAHGNGNWHELTIFNGKIHLIINGSTWRFVHCHVKKICRKIRANDG